MLQKIALILSIIVFSGAPAFAQQSVKPDGCDWYFERHQMCGKLTAMNLAPSGAESSFDLVTTDLQGRPVVKEPITVVLWMNMGSHGHGSSPVHIESPSFANYHVTKAYFVMAGKWEIRLTLDAGTPLAETAVYQVVVQR
jgi:hypothetical protein